VTDRIAEPWGERTPYGSGAPWPVRADTFLTGGVDRRLDPTDQGRPRPAIRVRRPRTRLKQAAPQALVVAA
jgi:hypothetical protein